jgi:hypothetical protein
LIETGTKAINTSTNSPELEAALAGVPKNFRTRLLERHAELRAAYSDGQHDSASLRAGRFAEALLRLLQHELTGTNIPFNRNIGNFTAECLKIEKAPKEAGDESLRLIIPRALHFLHTIRNKRGVAHEGGDVDANEIDAATCVRVADWCLCELIRLFNAVSLEEAQDLVDAVAMRQTPDIWSVAGKKRVLDASLKYKEQTLLLLYSEAETAVPAEDLLAWTEHRYMKNFRRDVLTKLHDERLIEYDRETEMVTLSPTGAELVEEKVLPKIKTRTA